MTLWGCVRREEAAILAELADLTSGREGDVQAEEPAEGTQAEIAGLPQIAPPPRGFGIGTGQLLWGNSRAADWQAAGDTGGAEENSGGGGDHGLAEQDMNPLTDAAIDDV